MTERLIAACKAHFDAVEAVQEAFYSENEPSEKWRVYRVMLREQRRAGTALYAAVAATFRPIVAAYEQAGTAIRYVKVADIPEPWRSSFVKYLQGAPRPIIEGQDPSGCAYSQDWRLFINRGRSLEGAHLDPNQGV